MALSAVCPPHAGQWWLLKIACGAKLNKIIATCQLAEKNSFIRSIKRSIF